MYWSRTGSVLDLIAWLIISLLTWAGGWLICAALFRIRPREQLFSGLAVGLMLFTLLGNLLAQFTALTLAYWIAGALIFAAGLASGGTYAVTRTSPAAVSSTGTTQPQNANPAAPVIQAAGTCLLYTSPSPRDS